MVFMDGGRGLLLRLETTERESKHIMEGRRLNVLLVACGIKKHSRCPSVGAPIASAGSIFVDFFHESLAWPRSIDLDSTHG